MKVTDWFFGALAVVSTVVGFAGVTFNQTYISIVRVITSVVFMVNLLGRNESTAVITNKRSVSLLVCCKKCKMFLHVKLSLCVADVCTSSPQTAEELESRSRLLRLLDSVIDALVWAISKLGLTHQQQTLRLGHLTMLLSHIRHVRYGQRRQKTECRQQNPHKRKNTI